MYHVSPTIGVKIRLVFSLDGEKKVQSVANYRPAEFETVKPDGNPELIGFQSSFDNDRKENCLCSLSTYFSVTT